MSKGYLPLRTEWYHVWIVRGTLPTLKIALRRQAEMVESLFWCMMVGVLSRGTNMEINT